MHSKVVFLDFDGVIKTPDPKDNFKQIWRPDHIQRLTEVLPIIGAQVVISSYWRIGATKESMSRDLPLLAPFLHKDFCTPFYNGTGISHATYRDEEVTNWLNNHKEVTEYAILEDMKDNFLNAPDAMLSRIVWCDFVDGFTEERKKELLQKFGVTNV